jgi:hypothetical protein
MSNLTNPRKRVKPARTVQLVVCPNDQGENGLLRITVGKQTQDYLLARVAADFGRAFRLQKVGAEGDPYLVNLDGQQHTCTCPRHSFTGHCKHTESLADLIQAGQL